jgi:hypothetical protein
LTSVLSSGNRFAETGIEIPYAKHDLYIRGLPEGFAPGDCMPGSEDDDRSRLKQA